MVFGKRIIQPAEHCNIEYNKDIYHQPYRKNILRIEAVGFLYVITDNTLAIANTTNNK